MSRTSGWNWARSAAGTPSSSPMTFTGSGKANASMKSTSPLEAVEQVVDHRGDRRTQRLHPARRERLADQPADAGVVGWVENQHAREQLPQRRMVGPVREPEERQHVRRDVAEPRIAGDGRAVGVPRDHQGAVVGPDHRGDLPQPSVPRIRVFPPDERRQLGQQRRNLGRLHDTHPPSLPTAPFHPRRSPPPVRRSCSCGGGKAGEPGQWINHNCKIDASTGAPAHAAGRAGRAGALYCARA